MNNLTEDNYKVKATQMAVNMFNKMCNELIDSLTNRKRILDAQKWKGVTDTICLGDGCNDPRYYEGAKDAFDEISRRLFKEIGLILNRTEQHSEDNQLLDELYDEFREKKNKSADTLINADRFRGTRSYQTLLKLQGKVASLLENASTQGFNLGIKYHELKDKQLENNMTADELRRTFINLYVPKLKDYWVIGDKENGNYHELWSKEDIELIKKGKF